MNLEPAPRLPKWIFLAIDAGLLLIAFLIVSFAKDPYAPLPFVSAVLCGVVAVLLTCVPFLMDYAADSAEFVQRERERMNEQAARLHASVESLARAAAQIKAVEEAVHKSAREAETLPYRMQEKLAEFNEALAAREESDREALETELEELRGANSDQLKGVAEKIAKAAADWSALEVATRKQLSAAEAAVAKLQASLADSTGKHESATAAAADKFNSHVTAALKELDARLAELKSAAAGVPTRITVEAPVAASAPASAPVAAAYDRRAEAEPASEKPDGHRPPLQEEPHAPAASTETPASAAVEPVAPAAEPLDLSATVAEPPKPKKPRAPRKPKAEDTLAAMSELVATESAPATAAVAEAAPATIKPAPVEPAPAASSDEGSSEPVAGPVESSSSSDGATRLLATAYIGIGNKLFIRGDGPGLSWEHGVPMQFVSIGKWGWSTHDAAGPIRCKLYKNDETAALIGEIVLEAGRHTEVTALF